MNSPPIKLFLIFTQVSLEGLLVCFYWKYQELAGSWNLDSFVWREYELIKWSVKEY